MSDIKVRLSISLPGRELLSKQECLKNPNNEREGYDMSKMDYNSIRVANRKGGFDKISFYTRKCKPAIQIINLTRDAYDYFISNNVPIDFKPGNKLNPLKVWNTKSKKERLIFNLEKTAEALGGTLLDYKVFDD